MIHFEGLRVPKLLIAEFYMDIAQKRKSIRIEILRKRENLSSAERATRSKRIVRHVIEWIQRSEKNVEGCSFDAVMVYLSMKGEVETQRTN